ncbi:hypothetical protein COB57_01225 [Candidatus Peregrinibacteria bacterium]|nr:MAG: hypothetical protein COB57_01225 [Candidatus Peregrinibacteria bacterium]
MNQGERMKEIRIFLGKNNYTAERWMKLTTKEKKILDKNIQDEYGFGMSFLYSKIGIQKKGGNQISPIKNSEDMMHLGEEIFGPHQTFDKYREIKIKIEKFDKMNQGERMKEIRIFLGKNNYTAERWMELTTKEKKTLDKNIQDKYGFGISFLYAKIEIEKGREKNISPVSSSEDMMHLGEKIFGPHKLFDEYREKRERGRVFDAMSESKQIKEVQKFLEKNHYTVDIWMSLQRQEKQILDKNIQEEYGFGIRSLCANWALKNKDKKTLMPVSYSEDMMYLGEKIFGKHQVFYEHIKKLEKKNGFDKISQDNKIKEIQRFLEENHYTLDRWLKLTKKEKKILDQRLYERYNFGLQALYIKITLKKTSRERLNLLTSTEDIMELGEKIFGSHHEFDTYRSRLEKGKNFDNILEKEQIKEIQNFLGKNSYKAEGWMALITKDKKILDKKIQKEYNFGICRLCIKFKLQRADEGRMNPIGSSEDMKTLGEKIFNKKLS